MIELWIEPSGEAPELARAEAVAASEALGGRASTATRDGLIAIELPEPGLIDALAARIALARRCLVEVRGDPSAVRRLEEEGESRASAAIRRLGRSPGASDESVRDAGRRYVAGGGTIDLEHPDRRYWLARGPDGADTLYREVAAVDRADSAARRMPLLPFQRPVSLPPRLARAAANLARIRPGDRVVDPFLGTGALLAEAALLGARAYGIDRDPTMVRGALRNFAHLGVEAARFAEGDASEVDLDGVEGPFDALLTDPPYGRSSSTDGATAEEVVARVVPRWADRVRPGGRVVVIAPEGAPSLPAPWVARVAIAVRVHRSLTREFRAYERAGDVHENVR